MRRVEGEEPDLIFLVENHAAQNKVLVRVGGFCRNVPPGIGVRNLKDRRPQITGIFWIEAEIKMFENEVRLLGGRRANEQVRVGNGETLRKNREQFHRLVRRRNLRFEQRFRWIQNNPRSSHLGVLQQFCSAVPHPVPETVVCPDVIDVD